MINKEIDYVVVGAGLSGSVIANRLANAGKKVLVLEKRNHIGGNVYDEIDSTTGVLVQKYGPHIFHTNNEDVMKYIKLFSDWEPFVMKCGVDINGVCTPSPFNFKTVDQFFELNSELIKSSLKKEYPDSETVTILELLESPNEIIREYAKFLFDEDYSLYTAKQWGISPDKVDKNVLRRVPVRLDYNEQYFTDKYQVMPKYGFAKFVSNMLNHCNIMVKTGVDALDYLIFDGDYIKVNNGSGCEPLVIWTGSIDSLFKYDLGVLPYRSLTFKYLKINSEKAQDYPVVAHPRAKGFTRITDYNNLPPQQCQQTVIAYEYPVQYKFGGESDPYYPINNEVNNALYDKYKNKCKKYKNLLLLGRLANYKYFNMDEVISEALKLADSILK